LVRILFVCTGNLCRSPVAERLAAAWARDLLRESPELTTVEIGSAGIEAPSGRAMDARSAAALIALGGDPAGFRTRLFDRSMAEEADLVLTMSRRQRREVLEKNPRGLRQTFTLLEAAELLQLADLDGLQLLPLPERARELGLRLDAARARRATRNSDDVLDPIGRSAAVHADVAATIATALHPLADVLFSSVRPQPAVPVEEADPRRNEEPATGGRKAG
jgi:protein-tyrosine phosphatase